MDRMFRWFDDRLHIAKFTRSSLRKIFPDNWSFMLGEIALLLRHPGPHRHLPLVLLQPQRQGRHYDGSYVPLKGPHMTEAFSSSLRISFDLRAGLVFRQMHHSAVLLFTGAVLVHLLRVFFTGAFCRPGS